MKLILQGSILFSSTVSRLYSETDLTGLYRVFLSFAQNIDCGYFLELPTIYILSKIYTWMCFLSEDCLFSYACQRNGYVKKNSHDAAHSTVFFNFTHMKL